MKQLIPAAMLLVLLYSCSKNNEGSPSSSSNNGNASAPSSLSSQFVGNWKVYESVDQSSISRWHVADDTFYSKSISKNDTVFGLVQSNRIPIRAWVGTGSYSADTLYFKPVISGRKLNNNAQGLIGTYSDNKDTLIFTYGCSGPMISGAGSVYWVSQKWIRQ